MAGENNKLVQFTSLHNFNLCTANRLDLLGKAFTRIATIYQKLLYVGKAVQIEKNHLNGSIPVRNIGSRYCDCMRQPHRIYYNMALDP